MTPSPAVVWGAIGTGIALLAGLGFYLLIVFLTRPRSRPPRHAQATEKRPSSQQAERTAWRAQADEAYSAFAQWKDQRESPHRREDNDQRTRAASDQQAAGEAERGTEDPERREQGERTRPGIPDLDD